MLILLAWQQVSGVLLAVILLGAGRGAVTLMRASLVADRYGRAHYGAIGGALALFVSGAAALAPVGAGVAYEVAAGYVPCLRGWRGSACWRRWRWWGCGDGDEADQAGAHPPAHDDPHVEPRSW